MEAQNNDALTPKYPNHQILSPSSYRFLEYHMIPQHSKEFSFVYKPGDDSFLMLSVLYRQIQFYTASKTPFPDPSQQLARQAFQTNLQGVCEVGSGSGILSAHFNHWLKDRSFEPLIHIATDISPDACLMSSHYFSHYGLRIQVIHTSLLNNLKTPSKKIQGNSFKPKIIICNPPYIPTEQDQTESQRKYMQKRLKGEFVQKNYNFEDNMIGYSWMGGEDGLETTRKLVNLIDWECIFYFIVMGEDWVVKLKKQVQWHEEPKKLEGPQRLERRFQVMQYSKKYNEELYVIRISYKYA